METSDGKVVLSVTEKNRLRGQKALKGSTVLQNIQNLKKTATAAQQELDEAVAQARAEGYSWVAIAAGLGVSPQGARQKYLRLG
ncbi:MAG: hypothetical protein FWG08_01585 [Propionibacteriaceae bacterium]|jgi:hypothetical protein|nr:hypothetical protein [Propionibacteriaceae bacterium]